MKSDRGALLYLDPMKRGDVVTLNQDGVSVLFICGIPRAKFDHQTEVLTLSRQLGSLSNSEWMLEQIYAAFPGWRTRKECNQPILDRSVIIER